MSSISSNLSYKKLGENLSFVNLEVLFSENTLWNPAQADTIA